MTFVSLNTIINDLLLIIRSAEVNQSEPISRTQIEFWVHQYRAKLIKQDIDKGKLVNPDYVQEISPIKLEKTADDLYRTNVVLPKTIDLNYSSGYTFIGTIDNKEIQYMSQTRSQWQEYSKYTAKEPTAYLEGGRLYVKNANALTYIKVKGVFEVPSEVVELINPITDRALYTYDDAYPIPANMIPTLKEMILKSELNIESRNVADNTNDSNFNLNNNQ